jgi:hypothetical protein
MDQLVNGCISSSQIPAEKISLKGRLDVALLVC